MKPIVRPVVGACAAGALLAAASAVPAQGALPGPGAIQIAQTELRHTHVDLGTPGRSVGDLDVYVSLLYNRRITTTSIGRATMVCTLVGGSSQSCTATYDLPKGELVVQGVIASRLIYAMAVVGGTGLYDNVRGSLTVTSLRQKPKPHDLVVFRLVV